MDLELFPEPEHFLRACALVLAIGGAGYGLARRWPATKHACALAVVVAGLSGVVAFLPPSGASEQVGDAWWQLGAALGICTAIALGLPLLGARQSKSRPAR